jgi:protein gp37
VADKTGIVWTHATWNPISGCTKKSAACRFCYAERDWARLVHLPAYAGRAFTDVAVHEDRLDQPLRWRRPRRIFVNSMSDLFHEAVPEAFVDRVFAVMALAKQHRFQVLTKRPDRMQSYMTRLGQSAKRLDAAARTIGYTFEHGGQYLVSWPLPNVWIGVSVEDQTTADERIPLLLQTPAAVRWISAEPLLGPISFEGMFANPSDPRDGTNMLECLDWVVVGGESGPKARPMHPDWAKSLRDQCAAAGVPFLFKQWGTFGTGFQRGDGTPVFRQFASFEQWVAKAPTWVNGGICIDRHGRELKNGADMARARDEGDFPVTIMHKVGPKAAGRLLDGVQHDGYPSGEQ